MQVLLKIDRKDGDALLYIGNSYYYLKNFKTAISYYEQAQKINSSSFETWYRIGLVYFDTGNYSSALESLNRAIGFDSLFSPNYYYAYFSRGLTYAQEF